MRTRSLSTFCAGLAVVFLAACGGGGDKTPAGAKPDAGAKEGAPKAGDKPAEGAKGAKVEAPPAEEAAAAGEPVEVSLWHAYRGAERDALRKVVAQLNKAGKGVTVKLQGVPYQAFVDKVQIQVPRGQGPDLFIFAHNMIGPWVEKGILEPMSERVPREELDAFTKPSVKALVYQRNLYGLPLAFKSLALYYNKGLLPEGPGATMEGLIPKLQAVQKSGDVKGLVYDAGLLYNHATWLHAFGGQVFPTPGKPGLASAESLAALTYVRGLHKTHGVLPSGIDSGMVTQLFNEGKAATVLNGPWFRAELNADLDYGVALIPSVEGKPALPFLGIEAVFVSKTGKKKDAATTAARFLASQASAQLRFDVGKQPVCVREVLEAGAANDPVLRTFMQQAEQSVIMDMSPEMQLVWSSTDMAIRSAVFGDKDPKEALEQAQGRIVEDIAKRGK